MAAKIFIIFFLSMRLKNITFLIPGLGKIITKEYKK